MKNCSVLAFDSGNVDEVFDIRQGEGVYSRTFMIWNSRCIEVNSFDLMLKYEL